MKLTQNLDDLFGACQRLRYAAVPIVERHVVVDVDARPR